MNVLSRALRGDTPSDEELAASTTWPSVSRATTDELRRLGCGDQSQCPPESHKVTRSHRKSAL